MSFKHTRCAAFTAWLLFAACHGVSAQPTPDQSAPASVAKPLPFVSPIFSDNMVLQRDQPNTIWGWSDPGDNVRVEIGATTSMGTAGSDRRWVVRIQPPAPGGPYSLTITDWRALFSQGNFPFYIVSLPAFTKRSPVPVDGDDWTETRESQAIAAATVPDSCLAVTIDTGDPDNIHAKEKQPVGDRLACRVKRALMLWHVTKRTLARFRRSENRPTILRLRWVKREFRL